MMTQHIATRAGRESIGDSVIRVLGEIPPPFTIIAIVPCLLTIFGSSTRCYEVTEVNILVDDGRPPQVER